MIHGEADDNSGTFPIQSERFYVALKGHGATVRYVTLPYEAHGYQARESVLHTVAEMLNWADSGPRTRSREARKRSRKSEVRRKGKTHFSLLAWARSPFRNVVEARGDAVPARAKAHVCR